MTIYTTMPSPVGQLLLVGLPAEDGVRLTSVSMDGQRYAPEVQAGWHADPEPFAEVNAQLGVPRDRIQALGAAIGANPLAIIRPCHRVVGSDGGMRGYAGGVERKQRLLAHEGALLGASW